LQDSGKTQQRMPALTPSDLFHPTQLLTLALFLGALVAVWVYVLRNKSGLARKMGQGRRISVSEVASLSPTDRAMILTVDGREFLVLRAKGSAPVVTPLAGIGGAQ
jgi:flagellar protein FliO/FliZ